MKHVNFLISNFIRLRRSALQTLYKTSSKAQKQNFFAGGPSHDWVQYYEERIESDRSCLNEWHAMDSLESRRPPSPDTIRNKFVFSHDEQ
jgi:protein phosphatase slingshot